MLVQSLSTPKVPNFFQLQLKNIVQKINMTIFL